MAPFGLALACVAGVSACSVERPRTLDDGFDRNALLERVALELVRPTYETFVVRAQALAEAAAALEAAVTSAGDVASARLDAQEAWREAMLVWQRAELLQVGPAGSSGARIGGADLRDEIYSWPTESACRVDQELAAASYTSPTFFADKLVNVYGLDAAGYLLFVNGSSNACSDSATINTSGQWAALGEQEVARRRAAYVKVIAQEMARRGEELVGAWREGGAFYESWMSAGHGSQLFARAQDAVNELFAAMYYLDTQVKDFKLKKPLGLSVACPAESCPEALEARWADAAKECLIENLVTFRRILRGESLQGEDGVGFDDFLAARGAPELAETMLSNTEAAIAAAEGVSGSFAEALAHDRQALVDVYEAVKRITDDLKSQFVSVLDLRVPAEGASDND